MRHFRKSTHPIEYLRFSINFHMWKWEQNVWTLLLNRNPSNVWKRKFSSTLSFHKLHYFTKKVYSFAVSWNFKTLYMFLKGKLMSNTKSHIFAFSNLIDQFGSQWLCQLNSFKRDLDFFQHHQVSANLLFFSEVSQIRLLKLWKSHFNVEFAVKNLPKNRTYPKTGTF